MSNSTCTIDRITSDQITGDRTTGDRTTGAGVATGPTGATLPPRTSPERRTTSHDASRHVRDRSTTAVRRLVSRVVAALRRGPTPGAGPLDTPSYRAIDATEGHHRHR